MKTMQELVSETKASLHCLTPEQAQQRIDQTQNGVLIDVREPAEVAQKRVKGFVNIPRGVLEMKIGELAPTADTPIYLHCASGGRAALSAAALTHMGYGNVHVIDCSCDTLIETMGAG